MLTKVPPDLMWTICQMCYDCIADRHSQESTLSSFHQARSFWQGIEGSTNEIFMFIGDVAYFQNLFISFSVAIQVSSEKLVLQQTSVRLFCFVFLKIKSYLSKHGSLGTFRSMEEHIAVSMEIKLWLTFKVKIWSAMNRKCKWFTGCEEGWECGITL